MAPQKVSAPTHIPRRLASRWVGAEQTLLGPITAHLAVYALQTRTRT